MELDYQKLILASLTDATTVTMMDGELHVMVTSSKCFTCHEGKTRYSVKEFLHDKGIKEEAYNPSAANERRIDPESVENFLKLQFRGSELVNELRRQLGIVVEKGSFAERF